MHPNRTVPAAFVLCLWIVAGWVQAAPAGGGVFKAGAATSNITPRLGVSINGGMQDVIATHIHDELHARVLVLDDGRTRLALVVADSCMLPREVIEQAKSLVAKQTGIPGEAILISATHAHSAPAATPVFQSDPDPEYLPFLTSRIADAVARAVHQLEPAKIGRASGAVPDQVFNRRWRMKPGTLLADPFGGTNDLVKMNPPMANPALVEPAGPTDPEVSVLFVQALNGRPLAVFANYSLHYVGGVGPGHVSADYFGAFADRVQQLLAADRLDPAFVAILSNGTSGNINNVNFRGGQPARPPYGRIRLVADAVAQEVRRLCESIEFREWIPLAGAQEQITLEVRKPAAAELERARSIMRQARTAPRMQTLEEIYARESVLLAGYPDRVPLTIQALRIGDLRICAIPCEVFVEIGLDLKKRFEPAFTISLANGYNGYLPTVEHHRLGGYETWRARSSYLEIEAAPKIVGTLERLLEKLR